MKSFYCLIISLSIHLCGYAILPTQFHFRHYNIENGVSSNNISTLFQDQKGYIWIGTENGLNRFDGNQFTLYQKNNPLYSNFHANSINTICETTDKKLWLGTYLYILPKLGPYLSNYFTSYSVLRQNYHNLFFLLYRNF